jgi:uncharacterized membrane protein (DUF373 family)
MEHNRSGIPPAMQRWTARVDGWFAIAAALVIDAMALFSLVALVYSAIGVGYALLRVIAAGKPGLLSDVIVEILTVFILVEVLGVSVRFLRANRIDVRDLVDVTLAIIFREIWVGMFSQQLHWQEMVALAALIVALGGIRFFLTEPRPLVRSLLPEGEAAETEEA